MGERTEYAPGTFCAVDLATPDPAASKEFYGGLFGWQAEDMPDAGAGGFSSLRLDGKHVAGLFEAHEMPPAWVSYVSVEDADATADRAQQQGGSVMQPVSEIPGAGRMAVIADPQGAAFCLWEPGGFAGAALVNDPGAFSLNQLNTSDPDAAQAFYGELFGWRFDSVGDAEQAYWGIFNGESMNGGMMPLPEGGPAPPHWLAYFTSSALEDSAEKITAGGGRVIVPPRPIPSGRIAVAQDPQGAFFALFEGRVDP